jgi:hypothetical protein
MLKEDQSRYTESMYLTTSRTIESCGDAYSQIDAIISRFNGDIETMKQDGNPASIATRFRWTLRQRKIKLLFTRLQAMKLNLLFNIQIMHLSLARSQSYVPRSIEQMKCCPHLQAEKNRVQNHTFHCQENHDGAKVRETLNELRTAGEASIACLSVLEEEDQEGDDKLEEAGSVRATHEPQVDALGTSHQVQSTSTLQTFHSALSQQDSVWLKDAFQLSNASAADQLSHGDSRNKQAFPRPWLTPWSVDHLGKHQMIRRSRYPGTRLHFTRTNEFQSWEESDQTSVLILHGSGEDPNTALLVMAG